MCGPSACTLLLADKRSSLLQVICWLKPVWLDTHCDLVVSRILLANAATTRTTETRLAASLSVQSPSGGLAAAPLATRQTSAGVFDHAKSGTWAEAFLHTRN